MRPVETATELTAFKRRGAGTDAERRAALWLAREARSIRRTASTETFWCRPNWPLAHAWHVLLAVAGSLVMVAHPRLGGALVLAALLCVVGDALTGRSPGRRLTTERASQNVVSPPLAPTGGPAPPGGLAPAEGNGRPGGEARPRIRLIVTANYDAGRTGLVYRQRVRAAVAAAKRIAGDGRLTPGWMGWLTFELLWLVAVAVARNGGARGTGIGVVQLIPTAALVVELALLLDLSVAPYGPAAGDNAGGTAVALALVRALDAAPLRRLDVELVLQGAGEAGMVGLRHHLRSRRRELRPANTIVLGIGPAGAGRPCWWVSDGPLIPLHYLARLRDLAARTGGPGTRLGAVAHRGRGVSPALPARTRGIPALTIGCLNARGLAPRSHQPTDVPTALDPIAMDRLVEFALTLVDAIDAELARPEPAGTAAPAAAA
jgi:hypothetical protein